MNIKHFAGYGIVTAQKIGKTVNNNNVVLSVLVTGDHERGLIPAYMLPGDISRNDYMLKKWLIERFDKKTKEINPLRFIAVADPLTLDGNAVKYTFSYSYENDKYIW